MTLPWGKVPFGIRELYGLYRLSADAERCFWGLFFAARWRPPHVGLLGDEAGHPFTVRHLEQLTHIPRTTIHRQRRSLLDLGLLIADREDRTYVHPVIDIDRRYPRRNTHDGTTTTTTSAAVENLTLFDTGPPVLSHQRDNLSRPRDNDSLSVLPEVSEDVRSVDFARAVENHHVGPLFDLVPSEIEDDQTRYLLARLAEQLTHWEQSLRSPRDRHALVHLASTHPNEVLTSLRQERESPSARNPLAWLTGTVKALAEAAS